MHFQGRFLVQKLENIICKHRAQHQMPSNNKIEPPVEISALKGSFNSIAFFVLCYSGEVLQKMFWADLHGWGPVHGLAGPVDLWRGS